MKGLIILIILLIIAGAWVNENYVQDKVVIGGISIASEDYKAITDPLPEGKFVLCSIEQGCSLMEKLNIEP